MPRIGRIVMTALFNGMTPRNSRSSARKRKKKNPKIAPMIGRPRKLMPSSPQLGSAGEREAGTGQHGPYEAHDRRRPELAAVDLELHEPAAAHGSLRVRSRHLELDP